MRPNDQVVALLLPLVVSYRAHIYRAPRARLARGLRRSVRIGGCQAREATCAVCEYGRMHVNMLQFCTLNMV